MPDASAAAKPAAAAAPVAAPPPALTPWGAYGTTTKKTKASKLKARPEAPIREEKLPRAVLQQYCQNLGWQPPRFERIPGQGYRYKAVVVPAAPPGGGKKKAGSSKVQPAPRSFQLFADEVSGGRLWQQGHAGVAAGPAWVHAGTRLCDTDNSCCTVVIHIPY